MNTTLSKANDLEKRLINFASTIVSLSAKLPRTPQGVGRGLSENRELCRIIGASIRTARASIT
jgi:hypothetical protein